MIMVALQKCLHILYEFRHLLDAVLVPAQAFLAHRAVEAFDERLLVLLVGPCDPMLAAKQPRTVGKLCLKLTAVVGLDRLSAAVVFTLTDGPDKLLG